MVNILTTQKEKKLQRKLYSEAGLPSHEEEEKNRRDISEMETRE